MGRVVQVIEVQNWRGDLRVDLGEFVRSKARTFFQFTQVMKATDAERSIAAGEPKPRL